MIVETVTHWAHVKLTLGVDPTKYIHVLVPSTPGEAPHLHYRFSKTASPTSLCAGWSINYRECLVSGLEFIFDRNYPQVIDLIETVKESLRPLIDNRVIILASDDAFIEWLSCGSGRTIKWHNGNSAKDSKCRYLLVEVSEFTNEPEVSDGD